METISAVAIKKCKFRREASSGTKKKLVNNTLNVLSVHKPENFLKAGPLLLVVSFLVFCLNKKNLLPLVQIFLLTLPGPLE